MKQWNGINGCLYCEQEGVTLGGDHLHCYWPQEDAPLRTYSSLLHNAEPIGDAVSINAYTCLVS